MAIGLVVTEPFDGFERGTVIMDPAKVKAIRGTAREANVIAVERPDPPPPPPAAEPALVVRQDFGAHRAGDVITNTAEIADIMASPNQSDVAAAVVQTQEP